MLSQAQTFNKRIYTVSSFRESLYEIIEHMPELKKASRQGLLDQQFIERLMLAVTQVNGCRYCMYGHTKAAFNAGVPEEDIKNLAAGIVEYCPENEIPALLFAQHFAESKSKPDPEMIEHLRQIYGVETAKGILAYLRMITMGNLLGNTFDAILSRFKGKPAPESSFLNEVGVFILMPFLFVAAFLHSPKKPKSEENSL